MRRKHSFLVYGTNLLIISVIFVCLYHQFIFAGKMYAYSDIGLDTIEQYLPITVYEINAFRDAVTGVFDLNYGFGAFVDSLVYKYLIPFNLPLLICGTEYLHIGLLLSMYVKYVMIFAFGFLFFCRILKNEFAASVCAILWTFSGYAVLWGQHYTFLSVITAFTIVMYAFQLFLDEDKKQWLLIPAIAFSMTISYYFVYMSCYFLAIYGAIYLSYKKKNCKYILARAGICILALVVSACMAGKQLWASLARFFFSSRTQQVFSSGSAQEILYPKRVLMSFFARLFSNNTIGVGNSFGGFTNYYECAILSVSVLALFSFVYLLQGKRWKFVLGSAGVCVLAVSMPAVSNLLVFADNTQRWTFLLIFAQVMMIGFALADLISQGITDEIKHKLVNSVCVVTVFLVVGFWILYRYYERQNNGVLNISACIVVFAVAVVYDFVAIAYCSRGAKVKGLLICALIIELVVCNYATINDRECITISQWKNQMYYDGTEDVVKWIHDQDDSVYRVNKTYNSVGEMDAMLQGYNGLAVYTSTNSSDLLNLVRSYGYSQAGNHIRLNGSDLLANTLLGVKYVITDQDVLLSPDFYNLVYDDGVHCVYEYRYWMGFGYFYPHEIKGTSGEPAQTTAEKLVANLNNCCLTYNEGLCYNEKKYTKKVSILQSLSDCNNCVTELSDVLSVGTLGIDMRLYFDIPEYESNWLISGVEIKMTPQSAGSARMMITSEDAEFVPDLCDTVYYSGDSGTYYLDNYFYLNQASRLRLDISWVPQNIVIEELNLILVDKCELRDLLRERKEACVTDVERNGNKFLFQTSSSYDAILCVPLIYDSCWEAYVDGFKVDVLKINNGLLGISIDSGDHTVELLYRDNIRELSKLISVMSILVFVLTMIIRINYLGKRRG